MNDDQATPASYSILVGVDYSETIWVPSTRARRRRTSSAVAVRPAQRST